MDCPVMAVQYSTSVQSTNLVFHEYLDVVLHGVVLGLLRDEEPHVPILDFSRSWTNDFSGHSTK